MPGSQMYLSSMPFHRAFLTIKIVTEWRFSFPAAMKAELVTQMLMRRKVVYSSVDCWRRWGNPCPKVHLNIPVQAKVFIWKGRQSRTKKGAGTCRLCSHWSLYARRSLMSAEVWFSSCPRPRQAPGQPVSAICSKKGS